MPFSDGLGPSFFRRKMDGTRPLREEVDGKVFIFRQSWHFSFDVDFKPVLFPICTLTWRANNYVSRQRRGIKGRKESTNFVFFCTDDINQSPFYFPTTIFSTSYQFDLLNKK